MPAPYSDGTISITNGTAALTGAGTAWSTQVRENDFVFSMPAGAAPVLIGLVSSATIADGSLTLTKNWTGTTIAAGPYQIVRGINWLAGAAVSELLVTMLNRIVGLGLSGVSNGAPDADEGSENELRVDSTNRVLYQRRSGSWHVVTLVGTTFNPAGPWVGDPVAKFALTISTGDVAVNFTAGALDDDGRRHFALTVNAAADLQPPTNVAINDVFDILFTISGGPHVLTSDAVYDTDISTLVSATAGARTRLRFTVTAETAGTATAVEVAAVTFALNDLVEDGGFLFVSNGAANDAEPDVTPGSDANWTWFPAADGAPGAPGAPGSSDVTATSTTSLAIGTGSKAFTVVETNRGWAVGARLRASSDANPTVKYMEGVITAYSGVSLTVLVDVIGGSGTLADWTINLAGSQGAAGSNGTNGINGTNGADGVDPGILLTWDTGTTDADPGAGEIRADNASLASATFLYVNKANRAASSIEAYLLALAGSDNPTHKGVITLTKAADDTQATFAFSAVTDATGYVKLAVSGHSGATSFTAADPISFQFSRTGNKGADGAGAGDVVGPASAVDSRLAAFDGTTGKLLKDSGVSSASFATAAQGATADAALPKAGGQMTGNITMAGTETVDGRDLSVDGTKLDGIEAGADATPAASTTVAGKAEIAVASEFRTGTDTGRVLGVVETWGAAASVNAADGATVTVDLSTILGLTDTALGGNRTLDFTNPKEGQHFVLKFTAVTSTRTLTMDAIAKLWDGVEVGPYSITTAKVLYVCGFVSDGGTIEITSIGRRAA